MKDVKIRGMNPETWRKIKIKALQESLTIPELIRRMADNYIRKDKEKDNEKRN